MRPKIINRLKIHDKHLAKDNSDWAIQKPNTPIEISPNTDTFSTFTPKKKEVKPPFFKYYILTTARRW